MFFLIIFVTCIMIHDPLVLQVNSPVGHSDFGHPSSSDPSLQSRSPSHLQAPKMQYDGLRHWNSSEVQFCQWHVKFFNSKIIIFPDETEVTHLLANLWLRHPHLPFFLLKMWKTILGFSLLGMDEYIIFTIISNNICLHWSLFIINTAKYFLFFGLICSFADFKASEQTRIISVQQN